MKCIRSNQITSDELHPCFYCGADIIAGEASHCQECGHLICPHCDKCRCNMSPTEQKTLDYINFNYCMNEGRVRNFTGIKIEPWMSRRVVLGMTKSLERCSEKVRGEESS